MSLTADEAHKPNIHDIREWCRAFKADIDRARAFIGVCTYEWMHELGYLEHGSLTEKGEAECAA